MGGLLLGGLVSWEDLCREALCCGRSYVGRSFVVAGLMLGGLVSSEVLCREVSCRGRSYFGTTCIIASF